MQTERFKEPLPRRDFLGKFATGSFSLTMLTALVGILRLPKPAVLPESASRFKAGFPDEFPVDTRRWIQKRNVWLFHDALGFYAISSICPHLGCLVREDQKGLGYVCPCHGSTFDSEGRVLGGPSPRGLDWHELHLAADGRLMVDTSVNVSPGTRFNV